MKNTIINTLTEKGFVAQEVSTVKNSVVFNGISLKKPNENVAPVFYLDNFKGLSAEEIADKMIDLYEKHRIEVNTNQFTDKSFLLENSRICIQKKSTENIVKRDYLDLEVYVRCYISEEASFKVNKDLEFDGLFERAVKNTKGTHAIKGLSEMLFGFKSEDEMFYVVTNENKSNGASALYFKGLFKEFCRDLHIEKAFIIPSSINEVLIAPLTEDTSIDEITEIIKSVNSEQVEEHEQLSDHPYIYTLATDTIE